MAKPKTRTKKPKAKTPALKPLSRELHFVSTTGAYVAFDPDRGKREAAGMFGLELQAAGGDGLVVHLRRLAIDLGRVKFTPSDLAFAERDAKVLLKALEKYPTELAKLIKLLQTDPDAAIALVRTLRLTEADFQRQGGGLWQLVVLALAVLVGGCATPRRPEEGPNEEIDPEIPLCDCPSQGQVITGSITGHGHSRTSNERAARRAREAARDLRRTVQEELQRRYAIRCKPPCVVKMKWHDSDETIVGGTPQAGGNGGGIRVDWSSRDGWSVGGGGPGGFGGGASAPAGGINATHRYTYSFQMVCERP